MTKQIKTVHGQWAGDVDRGVNKLLAEGWRIQETGTVVTSLRVESDVDGEPCVFRGGVLVPEFVVKLYKENGES